MSNAKKCDRCGLFYEQSVEHNLNIFEYKHPFETYKYDLCAECHKDLVAFLDNNLDEEASDNLCYPKKREYNDYCDCSKCGGYLPQPKDSAMKPKHCMWCGAKVVY